MFKCPLCIYFLCLTTWLQPCFYVWLSCFVLSRVFFFDFDDISLVFLQNSPPRSGTIELVLIEARDLVAADLRGTSDPYVRVQYGNVKKRTKVCHIFLPMFWVAPLYECIFMWFSSKHCCYLIYDSQGIKETVKE